MLSASRLLSSRVSASQTLTTAFTRQIHAEARLASLGKKLPEPGAPKGSYVTCQWADESTLHLAGHLPSNEKGELIKGKVGKDITVEQAKAAAESACLSLLATLK